MVVETAVLEGQSPSVQGVAVGAYTSLYAISAPSEAKAGDEVTIVATVKNIGTYSFYIHVGGKYDGTEFEFSPHSAVVDANGYHSFSGSFIMPTRDVRVHVWSYYWTGSEWLPDDYDYVAVGLKVPVGWQLLDSITMRVDSEPPPVVGWQLLDSITMRVDSEPPPTVGWQLLDSVTVGIASTPPPPTGWQLLDSTEVSIDAGPLAPEYELIEHVITPWAYFYEGDAEEASISFSLIKGSTWIAYKLANRFAKELADRGFTLLEGKFYKDPATIFEDKYLVKVSYTMPASVSNIGVYYISPIVWNIIFYSILGVLVAFLISRAVNYVKSIFYSPPPFEESVKLKWEKPLIIENIRSQRPQYSSEELEAMSEGELRDLWDEIYEEEVPPKGIPWWGWAILGGVGIAGTSLALRFLPKKRVK